MCASFKFNSYDYSALQNIFLISNNIFFEIEYNLLFMMRNTKYLKKLQKIIPEMEETLGTQKWNYNV